MYKLYPVNIFYILYHFHLFLTELYFNVSTLFLSCVVNAEVKQEVTLTAPMINVTYRVRLWYTLYFPYAVFFVKLTSIYKWRASNNQISKHISASDHQKFAFKYLSYLSVICKNSFVLTLTHKSYVLSIYSLATKKTYHDHPEFSTFTIDLLADIDHRP